MSQRTTFTDDDEGKRVINAAGDEIGIVSEIKGGTAHVDPDPGLTDQIRAKLGWGTSDADSYALSADSVQHITDDEVHLRSDL
ncbi:PRC-barrel domain containing protein [Halobellus sp. GM3]|uniref:PRC-barrel domain containing protein n=1 Tax=Halobellus sp. GM3 TaxID=3458410 RepID=UPI00403D98BE